METYKPTPKQLALLKTSLSLKPSTPMKKIAEKAGVGHASISAWFAKPEFEHWWVMAHYEGGRGIYTEKIIRAICERAIQPNACSKDRELALQILAPERLNRAFKHERRANNLVIQFLAHDNNSNRPKIECQLPDEPRLITVEPHENEDEVIIEAEADVA